MIIDFRDLLSLGPTSQTHIQIANGEYVDVVLKLGPYIFYYLSLKELSLNT